MNIYANIFFLFLLAVNVKCRLTPTSGKICYQPTPFTQCPNTLCRTGLAKLSMVCRNVKTVYQDNCDQVKSVKIKQNPGNVSIFCEFSF